MEYERRVEDGGTMRYIYQNRRIFRCAILHPHVISGSDNHTRTSCRAGKETAVRQNSLVASGQRGQGVGKKQAMGHEATGTWGVFFSHLGLRKRGPGAGVGTAVRRCDANGPRKSRAGADAGAIQRWWPLFSLNRCSTSLALDKLLLAIVNSLA